MTMARRPPAARQTWPESSGGGPGAGMDPQAADYEFIIFHLGRQHAATHGLMVTCCEPGSKPALLSRPSVYKSASAPLPLN